MRTSLVNEARAAASLDYPNIIRVFDVDPWQNRTFVVMELVEGKSLADMIAAQEVIALPRALGIMRQIAFTLEQLHAKGIIHRDLKPANILITANEQVKVTDLGLALTDDSPLWNEKVTKRRHNRLHPVNQSRMKPKMQHFGITGGLKEQPRHTTGISSGYCY